MKQFDWSCFIKYAEHNRPIFNNPDIGEASCRSAISRAYYAAFHNAKLFTEKVLKKPVGSSPHQALQKILLESGDKQYIKIGNQLRSLHRIRIIADYKSRFYNNPQASAAKSITWAKKIIEELKTLKQTT